MNEVQIYIIGKGYLDLLEQTNFPLVINKSIANISDISSRDSTFSYDFEIPNNTNNNKILFGAEYVNATDKAILGKQDAVILLNGAEYERGFVEVKISKYLDKYVCNFFGGNAEWVELGNDLLVKDLGFSPDLNTFSVSAINSQNSLSAINGEFGFPQVDRNTVPSTTLSNRPVFYVKAIFERFFGHDSIGYTIESNFLNSKFVLGESDSNNKGLAVDLGCIYEFEDSIIENTFTEVRSDRPFDTSNVWYIGSKFPDNTGTPFFDTIDLTSFFNIEVSDEFNLWVTGTGYTAPKVGNYIISIDFRGSSWRSESPQWTGLWNTLNQNTPDQTYRTRIPRINLEVYRNGILTNVLPVNSLSRLNGVLVTFSQFCEVGDVLTFQIKTTNVDVVTGVGGGTLYKNFQWMPPPAFIRTKNVFTIQLKSKIEEGDQYLISQVIPKDMKAFELISDLKLLFNLYFDADIKRKVVKIEPRNDWKDADFEDVNGYYQSVGLATNWTNLIDLNFAPEIHTELPYNRTLIYKYKKDESDKWLEQWERNNNRTYAEYRQDLTNRFPNGETVFETTLISPTIQGVSSSVTTSIIRNEYAQLSGIDATQPTPNNKYNPRIGWFVNDVFLMEAFNDVQTFESTATKLTFNGVSGLIDKFWSKTLRNLINAVTLKVNVNLNKIDLRNFDFSKPVYIDAPQQIKGYYVVMSVEANLMNDSLVSAELLYYKDYAPLTIDATQGTNINPNKQQQQTAPPQFVLYETESGQLINVLDEDEDGNLLTLIYE